MTKISDAEMTGLIRCALRERYKDTMRFLFLEEVGTGTGMANTGWADAVLMHLWPSDGLALWGFEIKVSRTDWLKELKNPKKSEKIARHCDAWVIVAPKGLVRDGELPDGWGLWEFNAETSAIRTARKAPDHPKPKYIPRQFFAALFRRAGKTLPSEQWMARMMSHMRREEEMRAERKHRDELRTKQSEINRLNADIERYREAAKNSGLRLHPWNGRFEKAVA